MAGWGEVLGPGQVPEKWRFWKVTASVGVSALTNLHPACLKTAYAIL